MRWPPCEPAIAAYYKLGRSMGKSSDMFRTLPLRDNLDPRLLWPPLEDAITRDVPVWRTWRQRVDHRPLAVIACDRVLRRLT